MGRTPVDIARSLKRREDYLIALEEHGIKLRATQSIGVSHSLPLRWGEEHPEFAEREAIALKKGEQNALGRMEIEADRRAIEGVERPVYQGGKLVGHVRDFSDILLIFRMKGLAPEKYRDNVAPNLISAGNVTVQLAQFSAPLPPPPPQLPPTETP